MSGPELKVLRESEDMIANGGTSDKSTDLATWLETFDTAADEADALHQSYMEVGMGLANSVLYWHDHQPMPSGLGEWIADHLVDFRAARELWAEANDKALAIYAEKPRVEAVAS